MNPNPERGVLVWDAPVRIFHWLLAASFAGAWLTAESERWRGVHVTLGYTMAALLVWRLVWGFVGTRHARFADFVRGPRAVGRHLAGLFTGRATHHAGHNPAGALAIVAMMALIGVTTASGVLTEFGLGGGWLEELHEGAAGTLLGVVVVHLAGVVASSLAQRENLVRGMITGRKQVPPGEGIASARRGLAVLMLSAVLGYWTLQWFAAPVDAARGPGAIAHRQHHHEPDDD